MESPCECDTEPPGSINHGHRYIYMCRYIVYASEVLLLLHTGSQFLLTKGNRSLGGPRRKWEKNIRMDLNGKGINTRNRLIRLNIGNILGVDGMTILEWILKE